MTVPVPQTPVPETPDLETEVDRLLAALRAADVGRGDPVALALATGVGVGVAAAGERWWMETPHPALVVDRIENELRPRWTWWSNETAATLIAAGVRVAMCWDVAAVHRLLFGGWRSEPALVWAALNDLQITSIPVLGQLDLSHPTDVTDVTDMSDVTNEEGPLRPDLQLRPEWVSGEWAVTAERLAR